LQITQTQLHIDTSTTLHYDHFWRWCDALRRSQCVQITPSILWHGGNSARKGQVSTRFLGYPQYFEMNTATIYISPILRRRSKDTWFSVVTMTVGYKWVYNVDSPSIIYSIQTYRHTTRMTGEDPGGGGLIRCSHFGKGVEVWKTCAPFCSVPEYLPPITVIRRRHSAATSQFFCLRQAGGRRHECYLTTVGARTGRRADWASLMQ